MKTRLYTLTRAVAGNRGLIGMGMKSRDLPLWLLVVGVCALFTSLACDDEERDVKLKADRGDLPVNMNDPMGDARPNAREVVVQISVRTERGTVIDREIRLPIR